MPVERTFQERFVASVLAKEVVADVARVLGARGIEVMPIKGVLLQQLIYDDPAERPISDVDVLVPEGRYREAGRALEEAGYRFGFESRSLVEASYVSPGGMLVDLHARLFAPGRYRMPTHEVMARGRLDERVFGRAVVLPDDHDVYAHLVGSLASDHVDERAEQRVQDIVTFASARGMRPEPTARHLADCGVQRAARYSLGIASDAMDAPFARETLAELPSDPIGDWLGRATRAVVRRASPGSRLGALPAHVLNSRLPNAVLASLLAAANRARHRQRYEAST